MYCWIGETEKMEIQISNASEMEMKSTRIEKNIRSLEEDNYIVK